MVHSSGRQSSQREVVSGGNSLDAGDDQETSYFKNGDLL